MTAAFKKAWYDVLHSEQILQYDGLDCEFIENLRTAVEKAYTPLVGVRSDAADKTTRRKSTKKRVTSDDADTKRTTASTNSSSSSVVPTDAPLETKKDKKPTKAQQVLDECICPICKELMMNPTTTVCAHSFCIDCIKSASTTSCPVCRARIGSEFKKNTTLATTIAILGGVKYKKRLSEHERIQERKRVLEQYISSSRYTTLKSIIRSFLAQADGAHTYEQVAAQFSTYDSLEIQYVMHRMYGEKELFAHNDMIIAYSRLPSYVGTHASRMTDRDTLLLLKHALRGRTSINSEVLMPLFDKYDDASALNKLLVSPPSDATIMVLKDALANKGLAMGVAAQEDAQDDDDDEESYSYSESESDDE